MTRVRPLRPRPTWAHPIGWLGFALGLAFSAALIHTGMRSAPPIAPTVYIALSINPSPQS